MEVETKREETEEEMEERYAEMYEDLEETTIHTDKNGNEIFPTHVVVLKSGEAFFCHETIELERMINPEETELITVGNVLDYPEVGDRSIITVVNDNIDFIQEYFHQDVWDDLLEIAIESTVAGKPDTSGAKNLYM